MRFQLHFGRRQVQTSSDKFRQVQTFKPLSMTATVQFIDAHYPEVDRILTSLTKGRESADDLKNSILTRFLEEDSLSTITLDNPLGFVRVHAQYLLRDIAKKQKLEAGRYPQLDAEDCAVSEGQDVNERDFVAWLDNHGYRIEAQFVREQSWERAGIHPSMQGRCRPDRKLRSLLDSYFKGEEPPQEPLEQWRSSEPRQIVYDEEGEQYLIGRRPAGHVPWYCGKTPKEQQEEIELFKAEYLRLTGLKYPSRPNLRCRSILFDIFS